MDEFEAVKEGDEVEFEVIGSKFKQGDEEIVVVGRLKAKEAPVQTEEVAPVEETAPPEDQSGDRRVIVTPIEAPKRRKLKRADTLTI